MRTSIPPGRCPAHHRLLIDLCLRYLVQFVWHGPHLLLISRVGVESVLDALSERGMALTGLEAFDIDATRVRARPDLVYDATTLPGMPGPHKILRGWPETIWLRLQIEP